MERGGGLRGIGAGRRGQEAVREDGKQREEMVESSERRGWEAARGEDGKQLKKCTGSTSGSEGRGQEAVREVYRNLKRGTFRDLGDGLQCSLDHKLPLHLDIPPLRKSTTHAYCPYFHLLLMAPEPTNVPLHLSSVVPTLP